jgi:hypothetical protein
MNLIKSIVLACAPKRAFTLFTEHASEWWPPSRRHTNDPTSTILLTSSGRFYERAADGREVDLGKIRQWEPGRRVLLNFYPGTDAEHPTEVEISFTAEGAGTRVTIDHRPTVSSEALWEGRVSRYDASWTSCLAGLEKAAREGVANGN